MNRRSVRDCLVIGAMAFIFRGIIFCLWGYFHPHAQLIGDCEVHISWAESLIQGHGFHSESSTLARRVPGYAIFLALFIKTHLFPWGVWIAQGGLGIASVILIYLLTKDFFCSNAACIAASFFAVDYLLSKQCVYALPETLGIFFLILSVYFFKKSIDLLRLRFFALAGLFAALCALTKESLSYYFFILAVVEGVRDFKIKKKLYGIITFFLIFILLVSVWVVRNKIHDRRLFLTDTTGLTLYLGNNPTVRPDLYGGEWRLGVDTINPKDDLPGMGEDAVLVDTYYRQKAVTYIFSNPWKTFINGAIKAIRLWYPFYSDSSFGVKILTGAPYVLVMLGALVGMHQSRGRWPDFLWLYALIFYLTGIHALTVSAIRYRYPLMPFLMMMAGYGFHEIWLKVRLKKIKINSLFSSQQE